jgi:hypothetical protein
MNEIFQCGDSGALVAYLYDECSPGEHAVIATHIKGCVACASEIDALSATRRTLASWTPPDLALGFHITRSDVGPAKILEPKIAWWRAPLPAWAQAAAALVIFAAGLSLGTARNGSTEQAAGPRPPASVPAEARPVAASVSRDELAQLEQRIRTEMSQLRTASSAAPVPARTNDALLAEVRALVEQSNAEQNRDFTLRLVELAGRFDIQNRRVAESVGQLRDTVRTEFGQQRQVNQQLINRVSDR